MLMLHPYWGKNFYQFFSVLFFRLFSFVKGDIGWQELAPDEVQIFVLIFTALSAAFIGTFLVVTKMTMLANSLSHTILLGLILAFIIGKVEGQAAILSLSTLLLAALFSAFLTGGAVELLHRVCKLQRDASIGLVFTSFFALGILLVSLYARYSHLGVEAIMGNIDALHRHDIRLTAIIFGVNALLTFGFFKRLMVVTFDPLFARTLGISLFAFQGIILFQSALTAVTSFRAVGVFVFLALLVVPVITARFFVHKIKKLFLFAATIGILSSVLAVAISRHFLSFYQVSLSTTGLMALLLAFFLTIFMTLRRLIFYLQRQNKARSWV